MRATVSVAVTGFRGTEMTFWVTVTDVAAILDDQTGHAALDVTYEWHNGGQVGDVIERLLFSGVATAAY